MPTDIEFKVSKFLNQPENVQLKGAEPQIVLQKMVDEGVITIEEAQQAEQTVFFRLSSDDIGDSFERSEDEIAQGDSENTTNMPEEVVEEKENGEVIKRIITKKVTDSKGKEHIIVTVIDLKEKKRTTTKDGNKIETRSIEYKKVTIDGQEYEIPYIKIHNEQGNVDTEYMLIPGKSYDDLEFEDSDVLSKETKNNLNGEIITEFDNEGEHVIQKTKKVTKTVKDPKTQKTKEIQEDEVYEVTYQSKTPDGQTIETVVNYTDGTATKIVNGEAVERTTMTTFYDESAGGTQTEEKPKVKHATIKAEDLVNERTITYTVLPNDDGILEFDDKFNFNKNNVIETQTELMVNGQKMKVSVVMPQKGTNPSDSNENFYQYIILNDETDEYKRYDIKAFDSNGNLIKYDYMKPENITQESVIKTLDGIEDANSSVYRYSLGRAGKSIEAIGTGEDGYTYRVIRDGIDKSHAVKYKASISEVENAVTQGTLDNLETIEYKEDENRPKLGIVGGISVPNPQKALGNIIGYMEGIIDGTNISSGRFWEFSQTKEEKDAISNLLNQIDNESIVKDGYWNGSYIDDEGELVLDQKGKRIFKLVSDNYDQLRRIGVTLHQTEDAGEKYYVLERASFGREDNTNIRKLYYFKPDGTFDHMVLSDRQNQSVKKVVYPDGSQDIWKFSDDGTTVLSKYDSKNNQTYFEYRVYEGDEVELRSYIDFKNHPEMKIDEFKDGTQHIYTLDKNNEYNNLTYVSTPENLTEIRDSRGNIKGYYPTGRTTIRVADNLYWERIQDGKAVESGHTPYGVVVDDEFYGVKFDKNNNYNYDNQANYLIAKETAYNAIVATLEETLEILKNIKKDQSYLDASTYINLAADRFGGGVDKAIETLEGDLNKIKGVNHNVIRVHWEEIPQEFYEVYQKYTNGDFHNPKEMGQWLQLDQHTRTLNTDLSAIYKYASTHGITSVSELPYEMQLKFIEYVDKDAYNWFGKRKYPDKQEEFSKFKKEMEQNGGNALSTTLGYKRYSEYKAAFLKGSPLDQKIVKITNSQQNLEYLGTFFDLAAMCLEFKGISWLIGKAGSLVSKGRRGAQAAKAAGVLDEATEVAKQASNFTKALNWSKGTGLRMLNGSANFGIYDFFHEVGHQLRKDGEFDWGQVGHHTLKGVYTGAAASLLSSVTGSLLNRVFKNTDFGNAVEFELEDFLKKNPNATEGQLYQEMMRIIQKGGLAKQATQFALEVAEFTGIDMTWNAFDPAFIREQLGYEDESLGTTELMRLYLGDDAEGLNDLQVTLLYAQKSYKDQFIGFSQQKIADRVVGMFLAKGKMPATGGPRFNEYKFEQVEGKEGYYTRAGKEYQIHDIVEMMQTGEGFRRLAFDAAEYNVKEELNKHKEGLSARNLFNTINGKKHERPTKEEKVYADDIKISAGEKDGEYKVTTPEGKVITAKSFEDVLDLTQRLIANERMSGLLIEFINQNPKLKEQYESEFGEDPLSAEKPLENSGKTIEQRKALFGKSVNGNSNLTPEQKEHLNFLLGTVDLIKSNKYKEALMGALENSYNLSQNIEETYSRIADILLKNDILEASKNNPDEANKLYEDYLSIISRGQNYNPHVIKQCEKINSEFGVKVFLPENSKEAGQSLIFVYQELHNYKQYFGENLNYPNTLDFSKNDSMYHDNDMIGYFNDTHNTINVDGLSINRVVKVLRHEMAHANIRNIGVEFPEGFDPTPYLKDMLNAGLTPDEIAYSFTNMQEFLATMSQADLRNANPKFKEFLQKHGMPEGILNMERAHGETHGRRFDYNEEDVETLNELWDLGSVKIADIIQSSERIAANSMIDGTGTETNSDGEIIFGQVYNTAKPSSDVSNPYPMDNMRYINGKWYNIDLKTHNVTYLPIIINTPAQNSRRLLPDERKKLAQANNMDVVDMLLNLKIGPRDRFSVDQIIELSKLADTPEAKNLLKKLVNEYHFLNQDITETDFYKQILDFSKKSEYTYEAVNHFFNQKTPAGYDVYTYTEMLSLINMVKESVTAQKTLNTLLQKYPPNTENYKNFESILAACSGNEELTKTILDMIDMTKKDSNNNITVAFKLEQVTGLVSKAATSPVLEDIFKRCINLNKCFSNTNEVNFDNIDKLLNLASKDNELVKIIDKFLSIYESGNSYYRIGDVVAVTELADERSATYDNIHDVVLDEYNSYLNKKTKSQKQIFPSPRVIAYMMRLDKSSNQYKSMVRLMELVDNDIVGTHVFNYFPKEGNFNPLISQDVDFAYLAYKQGLSLKDYIVPTYDSIDKTSGLKPGQVFEISGEKNIYIKNEDGTGYRLNIDKDTYYKLFPPVERYASTQGLIGNCWQITGFNSLLRDPDMAKEVLSCIHTKGNDIIISFPNAKQPIKFSDGKMPSFVNTKLYSQGALGIQMLEYAQAMDIQSKNVQQYMNQLKDDIKSANSVASKAKAVGNLLFFTMTFGKPRFWYNLDSTGRILQSFAGPYNDGITASRNGGRTSNVFDLLGLKDVQILNISSNPSDLNIARNILSDPVLAKQYVICSGTIAQPAGIESDLNPDKGIVSSHAYWIRPMVKNNSVVEYKFFNPWGISETSVSIDDILNYNAMIYLAKKNK